MFVESILQPTQSQIQFNKQQLYCRAKWSMRPFGLKLQNIYNNVFFEALVSEIPYNVAH